MVMEIFKKLKFDQNGLITAIIQDEKNSEVLMLAWMNKESLKITLTTGYATYFSRSRNSLWKKGATSGHLQKVVSMQADCDFDALLLKVKQKGAACHSGKRSCFFNLVNFDKKI
jgi:phosphoribosyl-AMP cyclohydrolase